MKDILDTVKAELLEGDALSVVALTPRLVAEVERERVENTRLREAFVTMERAYNANESALAALREQYNELIYAVVNKYPDENRHATALRQITQANTPSGAQGEARREP